MRRARLTFPGAFHHVMSRGHEGKMIFSTDPVKSYWLEILPHHANRKSIRILAWCLMDNHFHLILRDDEGELTNFMKELNGRFGSFYRRLVGGRGVVFDGRFRSCLIENSTYLATAIAYLLQNPVRAGLTSLAEQYPWSSYRETFATHMSQIEIVDLASLLEVFGTMEMLQQQLRDRISENTTPEQFNDRWGETMGNVQHRFQGLERFNRRTQLEPARESSPVMNSPDLRRKDDPAGKKHGHLVADFASKRGLEPAILEERTRISSQLRGILLLELRDNHGLTFRAIHRLIPFRRFKLHSLGRMYAYARDAMKKAGSSTDKNKIA